MRLLDPATAEEVENEERPYSSSSSKRSPSIIWSCSFFVCEKSGNLVLQIARKVYDDKWPRKMHNHRGFGGLFS